MKPRPRARFPPEAGQAAHQQLLQLVLLPHRVHNHPQAPLGLHAAQAGGDQVNQRALEQAGVLGGLGQGMHLLLQLLAGDGMLLDLLQAAGKALNALLALPVQVQHMLPLPVHRPAGALPGRR